MAAPEEVRYSALGVMSGSSLDGLDLALCHFTLNSGRWSFRIEDACTVPYKKAFQQRLLTVMQGSALELTRLDRDLGDLIGDSAARFLAGKKVDVIASHGHTIFHKPDEGLTLQIGHGARIAARTGLPTITDFRTLDVALGGQGAPLVPLGEQLLFPEHRCFINIGGICNIALHANTSTVGYDVCIGNQALNALAMEAGMEYDADGRLARTGAIHSELLDRLNALPFHLHPPPRSLGREWFNEELLPLIKEPKIPVQDRLRSVVEHIAVQLGRELDRLDPTTALMTGGGVHNQFLLERMRENTRVGLVAPADLLIDHKEALIFAFLGIRRLRSESTALSSVTGARRDSTGGSLVTAN